MSLDESLAELLQDMTLDQKLSQLGAVWIGSADGAQMAPMQNHEAQDAAEFGAQAAHGLGHICRHWGTRPLSLAEGTELLRLRQQTTKDASGHAIGAIVHEECLTGLMAQGATVYPTPLAWGATFDADLVEHMATRIGADMAALGIHQGLAPVLDVIHDTRWGRTEECISEDPLLVAAIGSAYVRGLESTGRVATLKHFVGYSASVGARNHAPVSVGRRELLDTYVVPFAYAIAAGARSVMNSYAAVDGEPVASSSALLTDLLRSELGFEGTVVADYYSVSFLHSQQRVASSLQEAGLTALKAGIDVELPEATCFQKARSEFGSDSPNTEYLDRAVMRVLRQKAELGLIGGEEVLDPDRDLDSLENREVAARVAEESVVLLSNDGSLPLRAPQSVAVIGPNAERNGAMLGCYSFVNHVMPWHPYAESGVSVQGLPDAFQEVWPETEIRHAPGCGIDSRDDLLLQEAVDAARASDVAILVVGDSSGMFGRGTSGEGCDASDSSLPAPQRQLVDAVLDVGVPTIIVMISGRPYSLEDWTERCAAVVQAFLPGQMGAGAIARIISGEVGPSGRLPVGIPRQGATRVESYRQPRLGLATDMTTQDPSPQFPFGFGLSYTSFEREVHQRQVQSHLDGMITITGTTRNCGSSAGVDVIELYCGEHVAEVARPMRQFLGAHRVYLEAGEARTWSVSFSPKLFAYTGADYRRRVEPGRYPLSVASDAGDVGIEILAEISGETLVASGYAALPQWRDEPA